MLTWAFSLGELIMLIGSTLFLINVKTEQKVQCSFLKKAMICCEEMNYVDYFALIKNLKHYKPHRKSLIHVVCYTDSQLINKKCITAIQI